MSPSTKTDLDLQDDSIDSPLAPALEKIALNPNLLKVWRIQWFISVALVAIAPSVVATIISIANEEMRGLWFVSGGIVLIASALVLSQWYIKRYHQNYSCWESEDGLTLRVGVWFKKETFVPKSRVQHTDVKQGPIARRWNMASLLVYTAAAHDHEVKVEGLFKADALRLRDALLSRDQHDAV